MRSFSPRHRALQASKRKTLLLADEIREAALAGRSVNALASTLSREVRATTQIDESQFPCFKCGAVIDEDTDTYGLLHVSAFSVQPAEGVEPTRFRGIEAPIIPICQICCEAFDTLLADQKIDGF